MIINIKIPIQGRIPGCVSAKQVPSPSRGTRDPEAAEHQAHREGCQQ